MKTLSLKTLFVAAAVFAAAGCSGTPAGKTSAGATDGNGSGNGSNGNGSGAANGNGSGATNGNGSGATNGNGSGSGANGNGSGSGANGGTTGTACVPDGSFSSDPSQCCSGMDDGNGYCASQSAGANAGAAAGGTTIQGSCSAAVACPKGYQCVNGQCALHSSSTLQVTLSFDDTEDFDLHLLEPMSDGGYCEIFYGNGGSPPDAGLGDLCGFFPEFCPDGGLPLPIGQGCPAGWLDRDSNAACGGEDNEGNTGMPDGVNVENILFANNQPPPSGKYYVYVDYWESCDGKAQSKLGVQVRLPNSAIYQYCPVISQQGDGPNDHSDGSGDGFPDGAGAGSGFLVTSFDVP